MAEESGGSDGWWGSWGSEFLSSVKAKSAETFSLVKQDLSEFVTTVQHDTTVTAAETANLVKEKLQVSEDETDGSTTAVFRQGVSQWLGSISTTLKENVSQLTAVVEEEPTHSQPGPVFDRAQAIVHEIQTDPATYCNDPDGHPAQFEDWSKEFELDQHKAEISELLVNIPEIRSLYTKLVPAAVTHSLFWTRYFYKMHQFEQEEKRKAALLERASKMEEEDIGWDDEDESWDVEEASKDQLVHHQPTGIQDNSIDDNHLSPTIAQTRKQGHEKPQEESKQIHPDPVDIQETNDNIQLHTTLTEQEHINKQEESVKMVVEMPVEKDIHNDQDDLKESTSTVVSSIPVTNTKELNNDDSPRGSSTPTPCIISQPLSKHKRTTSNTESEGRDYLKQENSSNSSIDSSWSKISDEEFRHSNSKQNNNLDGLPRPQGGMSPSHSEVSSSSVVVVPSIDEKDLDWDDDDLDFGDTVDDVNTDGPNTPDDDDDDDWENWE